MTMFIFVCLFAFALAEPPVGDGYPPRHSHDNDLESNLSKQYGVPGFGARQKDPIIARSQSSYIPSTRTGLSEEYGVPSRSEISREYGTPSRSLSQEYSVPSTRLSEQYGVPNTRFSEQYGAPSTRLSQQYGVPSTRLSQQYGVPNARLTQQYGVPSTRGPSQTYGVPTGNGVDTEYGIPASYNPNSRVSQEYGVPQLRSDPQDYKTIGDFPSDSYGAPLERSFSGNNDFSSPSEEYGTPAQNLGQIQFRSRKGYTASQPSVVSARLNKPTSSRSFQNPFGLKSSAQTSRAFTPSAQYGVPSTRTSASKPISQSYLPSSRGVSQTYGAPQRSLSTEYGVPEARNLQTNAYPSSFDTARSAPSTKYGVPSARDSMPSDQYGVPEQYAGSNQGYSYARNLDEVLNQEPANYDFGYKVSDYESGSDFGHSESRQENKAEGSYFVVLPDGTKQTVEYEADERGFKPRISVEPAEGSGYETRSGGY